MLNLLYHFDLFPLPKPFNGYKRFKLKFISGRLRLTCLVRVF